MDRRVTASTKARTSADRPATWAPTMEAPSGRAVVFAIGTVCAFLAGLGVLGVLAVGRGLRVGNRFAALPVAGLSEGFGAGMVGRLPTGRGEVIVTGGGGCAAVAGGGVAGADGGAVGLGVALDGGAVEACDRAGAGVGVGEAFEVVGPAAAEDAVGAGCRVGTEVSVGVEDHVGVEDPVGGVEDPAGVGDSVGVEDPVGVEDSVGVEDPVGVEGSVGVEDPVGVGDPVGVEDPVGVDELVGLGGAVTAMTEEAVAVCNRLAALPVTVS